MPATISNPVLKGFNPDPSILRVGDDYYIATSTFEWFPGVQIFHSKNLANWTLVCRPIGERHIDMKGNPQSGGVWAPCLTHDGTKFYLVYTDVKHWFNYTPFKDQMNFVTTAENITGPWSDPAYLNGSGFDGSMFHDEDGRKWFLNMEWDYRKNGKAHFSGIVLQEYNPAEQGLKGPVVNIFKGTSLSRTEAPHLYKKNGWYYLMTAEGGTSYEHAVTIVRSRNLTGPYEVPENHPLLTSWETDAYLQKAGHGSFIEAADGRWYLAHLCGRPLPGTQRCVLGRETAIQEIVWEDDWPHLKHGGNSPSETFEISGSASPVPREPVEYRFDGPDLPIDFQTLRTPFDPDVYWFADGALNIRGRESIMSKHSQSLVARRQEDFQFRVETQMVFTPSSFQETAGLIYRYDENHQYYLYLSWDEEKKSNVLEVLGIDKRNYRFHTGGIAVASGKLILALDVNYAKARFSWSEDGKTWTAIGDRLDASILSDDYVDPMGFTGAFVGMACQDLRYRKSVAAFSSFTYIPREY